MLHAKLTKCLATQDMPVLRNCMFRWPARVFWVCSCDTSCNRFSFTYRLFLGRSFYTHQLLRKPTFFDQPAFTQTTFCTNQPLQTGFLHKSAFAQTSSYTNQLLDKPPATPSSFCNPASTRTTFSALHNPCFGPVSQRPEGRRC